MPTTPTRRLHLARALATFALCPSAAAQDEPAAPATRTYRDQTGKLSIDLPGSWQERDSEPGSYEKQDAAAIEVTCQAPGWTGDCLVGVWAGKSTPLTGRGYTKAQLERRRADKAPNHDLTFVETPVPHAVLDTSDPEQCLRVSSFVRIRGWGFSIDVDCTRQDLARVRAVLPKLLASLRFTGPTWPEPLREGRKEVASGGIVVSCTTAAPKQQLKDVDKLVQSVVKEFTAVHDPIVRPEGETLTVYVNQTKEENLHVLPRPEGYEVYWEPFTRRVVSLVPHERGDLDRVNFVSSLVAVLIHERYDAPGPGWFFEGERAVATFRDATGRKLPMVTQGFLRSAPAFAMTLADVAKLPYSIYEVADPKVVVHGAVYVIVFRTGKKAYRSAYSAFLAEFASTGDGEAAAAKHLYSLDQEALRQEATACLARLQAPK